MPSAKKANLFPPSSQCTFAELDFAIAHSCIWQKSYCILQPLFSVLWWHQSRRDWINKRQIILELLLFIQLATAACKLIVQDICLHTISKRIIKYALLVIHLNINFVNGTWWLTQNSGLPLKYQHLLMLTCYVIDKTHNTFS